MDMTFNVYFSKLMEVIEQFGRTCSSNKEADLYEKAKEALIEVKSNFYSMQLDLIKIKLVIGN